ANTFNADNQNTADTFDGNGNPTTYNGTTLTFDPENRMTAYGTAMTAGYRADGLRAWKSNSTTTTYFIYDGITPVCEVNGSGTVTACNTFGAEGLLARHTSSSVYYAFDPQGNPAERLDSSDNLLGSYAFDAFGDRSTTDSSPDMYSGFCGNLGYLRDVESGLQLLGNRFYDAAAGRFLTRDPIHYHGGVNLYSYAVESPLTGVDPDGTASLVRVPGPVGIVVPSHQYIQFPDGYTAGFWPGGTHSGGSSSSSTSGSISSGSSSSGHGPWGGQGQVIAGPAGRGDPDAGPGNIPIATDNRPCFEKCLHEQIDYQIKHPPFYMFLPMPGFDNCITWSDGIWDYCEQITAGL
ncbi:MAG TPA: RHS repeat-associated core domain-containing protein, partial [Chthonomonadales bacterium]|nr:RHS repeat-associated core domain-containing protein [Chthonomonadales bacterium]